MLRHLGYIDLPEHAGKGGFDHADVHCERGRVYVAHTVNDCLDVIDARQGCYTHSIPGLRGVAGALVSAERGLVFTSNRRDNSVGVFRPGDEDQLVLIPIGVRPNGLAYDPEHNLLLAANVGDPDSPAPCTVSVVDVATRAMIADIPVPGRTRWAVYDPTTAAFYVNISTPAQIAVVASSNPTVIARCLDVPAAGPHGLDVDPARGRLYCACDAKSLVIMELPSGRVITEVLLSGVPDVIFLDAAREHLFVAVGDPGVIDVIDTATLTLVETVATEKGAHTFALDKSTDRLYVFLPATHRALVLAWE